jgi:hypothetical protein
MQNITKNISTHSRKNMTGNRQISIAPTDEIKSMTMVSHNIRWANLKTGCSFGKIEADEIEFGCRHEDGCYIHEISCRLVSAQGAWDSLFNRMKNKRWLVKIMDNNNIIWLSGSLTEPLRFDWEHLSEPKADGQHSYLLSFNRESSEPMYVTDTAVRNTYQYEEAIFQESHKNDY